MGQHVIPGKTMSYNYGMAAINLEMTDKVPGVEYSADTHWELVERVTSINVNANSDKITKDKGMVAFQKKWDYRYSWRIGIFHGTEDETVSTWRKCVCFV